LDSCWLDRLYPSASQRTRNPDGATELFVITQKQMTPGLQQILEVAGVMTLPVDQAATGVARPRFSARTLL
jgi:hypothetical protein